MSSLIRSRSEGWRLCFLLLALWGLAPRSAAGAELTEEAKAQAREQFNQGNTAYAQGDFRQALDAFEAAYQLAPLPGFLFNVAQCHRQLGNFAQAASSYRRYLALSGKEPPNAGMVKELIAEMEAQAKKAASRAAPGKPVVQVKPVAKDRPVAGASQALQASGEKRKKRAEGEKSEHKDVDIRTSRALAVEGIALTPAAVPGLPARQERKPLLRKWWLWAGAGAAALLTGGIVYALSAPEERPTTLGTIPGR